MHTLSLALLLWASSFCCCWGSSSSSLTSSNRKAALNQPRSLQDGPPENYVGEVFSFEFHLFSNSEEGLVDLVNSKVKDFLDTALSEDAPVFLGTLEAVQLGT